MNTIESSSSRHEEGTLHLFVTRGVVAIAWALAFAAVAHSLTTSLTPGAAILVVLYPLIDVVASVVDAESQTGSARRVLLGGAAVSAVAAVALGVAAAGSVANVLAVFGTWAVLSGGAQFAVAVRRRRLLGAQWPMLAAGAGSVVLGLGYIVASLGNEPRLVMLAIYAAGGGTDFLIQALLLARRRRRAGTVAPAVRTT